MSLTRRAFLGASFASLFLNNGAQAAAGLQYIVTDSNGNVIDRKASKQKRHPASLTKMMTLYCVMAAMKDTKTDFNLDTPVEIPELINIIGDGIAVFENLKPGQKYPAGKLMTGAGSRSDAYCTLALAIHLGDKNIYNWQGTERQKLDRFLKLMNVTAAKLGMDDTHFSVCTGLPQSNHYSTPKDIAVMMRAMQENFPKSCELAMGQPHFDLKPLSNATNHSSKILRRHGDEVMFAKTGWTNDAGYCLAVLSKIQGKEVTAVIFGADSDAHRNKVMETLLQKARNNYIAKAAPDTTPG
ncbi:MAG: hypothetical protein DI626_08310 [Micavibrio aeruginosavorus]|uniref:Peptidase S11 D-alanyl-D-alanine carboxypeptidase A N-terminal domain-containing protein n=1 Tax=Micavibrio aeruginosavorus TaxID=349221 RepID=A0A2W4ZPT5_9BACT|nr:MAG: hypothetical protein DI626_08310 [Micavibrio aeruginosavorus]